MKKNKDTCEIRLINKDKVARARKIMHSDDMINKLSETFKVLGDSTRIRIISALSAEELCVCDIAILLNMSDSAISHQLRILRNLRLVKYRKEGKMAFYSLDDKHINKLLKHGLEHISEG